MKHVPGISNVCTRSRFSSRSGFTLVELVVGILVSSILVVGLSSAMSLSLKGVEKSATPQGQQLETHQIVSEISSDLRQAISFSERTAKAVTFTVPDRDGDGNPETIRYAWSGTPGDPLTRRLNQNAVVTVAESVNNFDLDFLTRTMTGSAPGATASVSVDSSFGTLGLTSTEDTMMGLTFDEPINEVQSGEVLLAGLTNGDEDDAKKEIITNKNFLGQCFSPTLPSNTLHYEITRVVIYGVREGNADGRLLVGMAKVIHGHGPSSSLVEEKSIWEWSLQADEGAPEHYPPITAMFRGMVRIPPQTDFFLVLKGTNAQGVAEILYYEGGTANGSEGFLIRSQDGAASWSQEAPFEDLGFQVYGKYTTEGPAQWN